MQTKLTASAWYSGVVVCCMKAEGPEMAENCCDTGSLNIGGPDKDIGGPGGPVMDVGGPAVCEPDKSGLELGWPDCGIGGVVPALESAGCMPCW